MSVLWVGGSAGGSIPASNRDHMNVLWVGGASSQSDMRPKDHRSVGTNKTGVWAGSPKAEVGGSTVFSLASGLVSGSGRVLGRSMTL